MAGESILRAVVARLEEALRDNALPEPDMIAVRAYDVRVLFETIKRYGGRRDWTPSEANLSQLPGPVRRLIATQRVEIERLQLELLRSARKARDAEERLAELRRPAR